ncbi:MAG: phytanoyl-CoA dioxygenase family protein [Desulfobulbaceae bacterium]|nr:phytanoyl-CoA dioxygenase family protein [Desulfobulbaceae bacterium]
MVSAYHEAGVLILEGFASLEACAELRSRALQLVDEFDASSVQSVFSTTDQEQLDDRYFIESGDKIRFFFESDAFNEAGQLRDSKRNLLNKMGHAMHDLDPVFERFSRTPDLAEASRRLGINNPAIIQSMYIFKPPRIGGEVVCHQDSTYIYTEPKSCVGFWFALEDASTENGCMYFIPGQHKEPLKSRNRRIGEFSLETEVLDDTPWPEHLKEAAPARAGSVAIFDGRTPHLSGPNLSEKSRHAYTLHTIDRACHYPAENWLQRSDELPLRGFE